MRNQLAVLSVAATLFLPAGLAQNRNNSVAQHWVSTWATARQLVRATPGGGRGGAPPPARADAASPQQSATAPNQPQAAQQPPQGRRGGNGPQSSIPATLNDQTIRMVVHADRKSTR